MAGISSPSFCPVNRAYVDPSMSDAQCLRRCHWAGSHPAQDRSFTSLDHTGWPLQSHHHVKGRAQGHLHLTPTLRRLSLSCRPAWGTRARPCFKKQNKTKKPQKGSRSRAPA
jgi:hypothetical protein